MEENIVTPAYSRIATDIALRIARGELKENTKIYGRSVMSSEYGVSPETIRRALKLLEDMDVIEIRQNSGVIIQSSENARKYVERFGAQNRIRAKQKHLNELVRQQEELGRKIADTAQSIVNINEKYSQENPFSINEADIPADSPLVGHSLEELKFWQSTQATIIAIRRADHIILSPGPYASFQADDTIVFVGDMKCVEAVASFIHNPGPLLKAKEKIEKKTDG